MAQASTLAQQASSWSSGTHVTLPEEALSVARTSNSYRELVDARTDCIVEYHALRRGYRIVSHINYTLLRRVRSRREGATGVGAR